MKKYVCTICGYIYDEAIGIPDAGIVEGTTWEELPQDWVCPLCGATKSEFEEQGVQAQTNETVTHTEVSSDMKELSALEMSALCSNLSKGCEKQYQAKEAELFNELATYFKGTSEPVENPEFSQLLTAIETDLQTGFPFANATSKDAQDRGAMRALVWSEKVTRILKSLLTRYEKEGNTMIENTGVYVCTICGFIYVGDTLPELCPVCKVPNWKFEEITGRVSS